MISVDPDGAEHQAKVCDRQRSNEHLSADLRLTSTPQEHHQHKDVADWPDNEGDPLYNDEQVRWPVHSRRRPSW